MDKYYIPGCSEYYSDSSAYSVKTSDNGNRSISDPGYKLDPEMANYFVRNEYPVLVIKENNNPDKIQSNFISSIRPIEPKAIIRVISPVMKYYKVISQPQFIKNQLNIVLNINTADFDRIRVYEKRG